MTTTKTPRSRRQPGPMALAAVALAAACIATAGRAQTAIGRIVQADGQVTLNGQPARPGAVVGEATLRTGPDGHLQLRTEGGALVALPPGSLAVIKASVPNAIGLASGGLRLSTAGSEWRIELPDRNLRANGYLKLQFCASGCTLAPGLYGRISQGEAVLDYAGGRSVLRSRSFRWGDAASRPEIIAELPGALEDRSLADAGVKARSEATALLKAGLDAFGAGDDVTAAARLEALRAVSPGEPLIAYYLGLIELRRDNNAKALELLQQYARQDPEGASQRDVPKTLTVLSSAQLQQEVAAAVAQESQVSTTPAEPGTIAVQAFVNRDAGSYQAMAKGLAALIIADLSKVPGLKVLEREKVQLLVNEAKLGDAGLADTQSAVRSGRLIRAEKVVVGNFEVK